MTILMNNYAIIQISVAINTVTAQYMGTNTSLSYADNQPFGYELLGAIFDAAREFKAASN